MWPELTKPLDSIRPLLTSHYLKRAGGTSNKSRGCQGLLNHCTWIRIMTQMYNIKTTMRKDNPRVNLFQGVEPSFFAFLILALRWATAMRRTRSSTSMNFPPTSTNCSVGRPSLVRCWVFVFGRMTDGMSGTRGMRTDPDLALSILSLNRFAVFFAFSRDSGVTGSCDVQNDKNNPKSYPVYSLGPR